MSRLRHLVESSRFERAMTAVILVNAAALGAQTYSTSLWLDWVNTLCMAVFVVELGLRISAYGASFTSSGWNNFDAVVITASLIPGIGPVAQIARLARVARLMRYLPDAQVLISGALRAIPALGSLFALTGLLIFLYGMAAVSLFGHALPQQFGDLGKAALTLFVMLSLENFPDTLHAGMEVSGWAVPFFISYALLAAFIVFNLVIGIVISSLEQARDAQHPGDDIADQIAVTRAALASLESALGAAKSQK